MNILVRAGQTLVKTIGFLIRAYPNEVLSSLRSDNSRWIKQVCFPPKSKNRQTKHEIIFLQSLCELSWSQTDQKVFCDISQG